MREDQRGAFGRERTLAREVALRRAEAELRQAGGQLVLREHDAAVRGDQVVRHALPARAAQPHEAADQRLEERDGEPDADAGERRAAEDRGRERQRDVRRHDVDRAPPREELLLQEAGRDEAEVGAAVVAS